MPKIVDAEARRAEVVEAVLRIIAVDGLERASLREVADEAGLAVGSVRHYFAGSEELLSYSFAAVVDGIILRLADALARMHDETPGTREHHDAVLTLLGELLPLDERGPWNSAPGWPSRTPREYARSSPLSPTVAIGWWRPSSAR